MTSSRLPHTVGSILCLAVLCYAWVVLVVQHSELLYAIQDFSPWFGTADYFQQHWLHPGGIREWAGDWLTQFFYHPWLGATLIVLCWGISLWALIKANRLSGWWRTLAALPVLCLLASITDLGYWIFCLKAPSYWFGPTLGLLAVSLSLCAYSRCGTKGRVLILVLMILIGYPLLGWYATLGVLTMLLTGAIGKTITEWIKGLSLMLMACIIVIAFYHHSSAIHWREVGLLYGFHHLTIPEASSPLLELPFWLMAASTLLMPLLSRLQSFGKLSWLPLLLLVATFAGSNLLNYRNTNFHTELRMLRALDEGRWDDLLQEMRQNGKKATREMVIMKDVALAQKGKLGDEAFDYPVGGIRPQMNIDLPIHMAHSAAPLFYYWLGIPNYAFMWCMENNIEYGLSPFYLRLMYRCMVVNGEEEAALKYKKLLETTHYYNNYQLAEGEAEAVRQFMTGHDELTNDRGYSEKYLLERLSHEQYDNLEGQQIAVHFAILARDFLCFQQALAHYQELQAAQSPAQSMPKYFNQETFEWYYDKNTGNKSY